MNKSRRITLATILGGVAAAASFNAFAHRGRGGMQGSMDVERMLQHLYVEINATDEQKQRLYEQYGEFGKLLAERNAMVDGNELGLSHTATTVRKRDGEALVTDGPFAEVAEQLGGYYVVEAADLDEALEFARALPNDVVEVRPVVEQEGSA